MDRTCQFRFLAIVVLFSVIALVGMNNSASAGLFYISNEQAPVCVYSGPTGQLQLVTVYILHYGPYGVMGSRFKIEDGPGIYWTYINEAHPFAGTSGDTRNGITVCYGECLSTDTTPIVVASVTYFTSNVANEWGSVIQMVPHPDANVIEDMDCNGNPQLATGVSLTFKPGCDGGECCETTGPSGAPLNFGCNPPLPAETSTWGKVKSLYRD